MDGLYPMIFKRKSFRKFDDSLSLSSEELSRVESQLQRIEPLVDDIRIKLRIVKREDTTCKRGEYCLLAYSEKKDNYLMNIGYVLEQLDLWMASQNIGTCWYGSGKPREMQLDGLDFIIMLALGKAHESEFRQDCTKARRKELKDIWTGEYLMDVARAVRYAPSAFNTQPWRVFSSPDSLKVSCSTKGHFILIPKDKRMDYAFMDMGIFLCFMDEALKHNGYGFSRVLAAKHEENNSLIPIADYMLKA